MWTLRNLLENVPNNANHDQLVAAILTWASDGDVDRVPAYRAWRLMLASKFSRYTSNLTPADTRRFKALGRQDMADRAGLVVTNTPFFRGTGRTGDPFSS